MYHRPLTNTSSLKIAAAYWVSRDRFFSLLSSSLGPERPILSLLSSSLSLERPILSLLSSFLGLERPILSLLSSSLGHERPLLSLLSSSLGPKRPIHSLLSSSLGPVPHHITMAGTPGDKDSPLLNFLYRDSQQQAGSIILCPADSCT